MMFGGVFWLLARSLYSGAEKFSFAVTLTLTLTAPPSTSIAQGRIGQMFAETLKPIRHWLLRVSGVLHTWWRMYGSGNVPWVSLVFETGSTET